MADQRSRPTGSRRRTVLKSIGTAVGGLGVADSVLGAEAPRAVAPKSTMVLRQGDQCVPVAPFSGDEPVEKFYEYRIPDVYANETNGGTDPGDGPYYSSAGTTAWQRDGTSVLALYRGPDGLSLVIVHDSVESGPSGGGAATFELAGLPAEGSWAVRDDYYENPDTGEPATSNYDNWTVDGSRHVIDWTWANGRTDGGAFRGLGSQVTVTIDPSFNEAAALFGEHYEGHIESWQFLAPGSDGIRRLDLDMTVPVVLTNGGCEGRAPSPPGTTIRTVDFSGCGQAWIVFDDTFAGTIDLIVETTGGRQQLEIDGDDLERVPGRFGADPVYRYQARGAGKVLAVTTPSGRVENDHPCAGGDGDGSDPDEPATEAQGSGAEDAGPDRGRPDNGPPGRGNGNGGNADGGRGPPENAGRPDGAGPDDDRGTPGNSGSSNGNGR